MLMVRQKSIEKRLVVDYPLIPFARFVAILFTSQ